MRNSVMEDSMMGPAIYSDGDEFTEKAWEARTAAAQAKWARKALDADMDCIDGYVLLSHTTATDAEHLALLREAVRVGDRLWGPWIKKKDMHWWGFIGTRPYMRAMHELGLALMEAGDFGEAETLFRLLLKLNPNDNQGIRELAGNLLLRSGRWDEFQKLASKYKDDSLLSTNMGLLACALAKGDNEGALRMAVALRSANSHVLPLLKTTLEADISPVPGNSPYVEWGSRDEAAGYIDFFWDIWSADKMRAAFLSVIGETTPRRAPPPKTLRPKKGQKLH
jgi:tetratricopeptide (TPR) repeat protein